MQTSSLSVSVDHIAGTSVDVWVSQVGRPRRLRIPWVLVALAAACSPPTGRDFPAATEDHSALPGMRPAVTNDTFSYTVQPEPSWDYEDRLFSRRVFRDVQIGEYRVTYPLFYQPRRILLNGDPRKILPGDVIDDGGLTVLLGLAGPYSLVESNWYFGTGESRRRLDFVLGATTLQRLNELTSIPSELANTAHWLYLPLAEPPHRIRVVLNHGEGIDRWTPELLARFETIDPRRYCLDLDNTRGLVAPQEAPLPEAIDCLFIAGDDNRRGWQVASGQANGGLSTVDLAIEPLRKLRYLGVRSTGHLDMAGVANNHELEFLVISRGVPIANISAIGMLRNLRALSLHHQDHLTNLDFLAELRELRYLDVTGVAAKSLRAIETLQNLVEVRADESGIAVLPRRFMPNLQVLHVMSPSLPAEEVRRFARLNPQVKIWHSWSSSLSTLLEGVTRVKINDIEVTDGAEIARFKHLLKIDDRGSGWDCRCYGRPWLELFKDEERVATLAVYHGVAIRWREEWPSGVFLGYEGSRSLVDWLESHWITEPKRERQEYFDSSGQQ